MYSKIRYLDYAFEKYGYKTERLSMKIADLITVKYSNHEAQNI